MLPFRSDVEAVLKQYTSEMQNSYVCTDPVGSFDGERRGVYRVLVGKPEGMRPHGRPRPRWEDNVKMNLQEVGVWTGSSCLRVGTGAGTCDCDNEPSGSIKCGEFVD
jgi:hypothetical protein